MERNYKIAVLPGDGIGPEVIDGALVVLRALMACDPGLKLELTRGDVGEPAYEKYGNPLPEETLALMRESNAILFGAVGKFTRDPADEAKVRTLCQRTAGLHV
jgi:3-isopropylmalate dehydrogenase